MKFQLKPYQIKTVSFALEHSYSILALDMGLGKSVCALEVFNRLGHGQRLLVVCPAYLCLTWKNEVQKFYGDKFSVTVFSKGKDLKEPDTDIAITSYDLVQKAEYLFKWATIVVADEAHNLKSLKSRRTEFFHRAVFENSCPRLLLLSGTPILNRVQEFYSLITLCNYNPALKDPTFLDVYPDEVTFADRFSFRHEFEMPVRNRRVKIVRWEGLRRVDELKKWLDGIYIRFESSKELGLDPIIYKDVVVSEIDNSELFEAFQKFSEENKSVKPDIKALAALEKAPFTIRYALGLREEIDSPIVIFSDHRAAAKAIAEGLGTTAITGEMSPQARQEMGAKFQRGEMPFLVATFGSFSTGVTLTRAHHMVVSDTCWTPGLMNQGIYRINRIGQEKQCVVHRILGTLQDAMIIKALEQKSKVIKGVV